MEPPLDQKPLSEDNDAREKNIDRFECRRLA